MTENLSKLYADAEQGYCDLYSKKECADRAKEAEEEYSVAMKSEEGESEWFEHIVKAALLRHPKAAFALGRHYYENGNRETGLRWIDTAISALRGEKYKNWRPKESPDGKLDEDEVLMFLLLESGFTTRLDSINDRNGDLFREQGDWVPDYKKALEYLGEFCGTYSYLSRKFHSGIKQPPIKADDMFVEPPLFDGKYAEHNWAGSMAHTLYLNNHNYGGFSDWWPLCLDEFYILVYSGILPNEEFLQGGIYDGMEYDEDMEEDDYERYHVYSTRGYSDAIDSLVGYVCCVSHGEKSEEEDSTEENFDPQAVQIVDKGDYIELSPAIGNIRMIAKERYPEMTWNEAFDYAKKLRAGGFSDWRLPTKEELVMIYKMKDRCGISVDHFAFFFWSSSTYTDNTDAAWIVNFDLGYVDYAGKANDDIYVCCVR